MKPVKAFASCTARCASYFAALPQNASSIHLIAGYAAKFTDFYRRSQTREWEKFVRSCLYLSVFVRMQNTMVIFLLIFVKIRFFRVTNAVCYREAHWILSSTGEKTFYPRSNLKNDLWRYIVHRKVMIRWKRFCKKQSSQQRRWLLSVFSCKLRLCLIIIGVVCGKKALKLPASIKRHVKLLCRWNMFSIILQFPEQIYRCIQERR